MLYLKQTLKSILKYKTHTSLAILSLIVSFTGIIILSLYISFEKSFESFHKHKSSIFRLETIMYGNQLPAKLDEFLRTNFTDIDESTVLAFDGTNHISTPKLEAQNIAFSSKIILAPNSFFKIFSFPLVSGDAEKVLQKPFTVVISESLSQKLFGHTQSIGETIVYKTKNYQVVGIMNDFPKNSSFNTDCIISLASLIEENDQDVNSWEEWSFNIYLKIKDSKRAPDLAKTISQFEDLPVVFKGLKEQYPHQTFFRLEPLSNIHFLSSEWNYYYKYTNPFILKALFVLMTILAIMGIVNFINFSTAQAPLRSKILFIFKVMGSSRTSSMGQVILESILISFFALILSLVIYFLIHPYLSALFNIDGLSLKGRYHYVVWFILFAIFFGFMAGIYPSIYMTKSSSSISNTVSKGKIYFVQNGLVLLQFVFTITLIISAFIIEKQLLFWKNFDIGINKEHVVYLHTSEALKKHSTAFTNELMNTQCIVDYTYSQFAPGEVGMGWGREINGQFVQFHVWPVDARFIDFFNIQIKEGRKFSKNIKTDINNFIINQKSCDKFQWQNPLVQKISGFNEDGHIIGVTKNFNFSSLKEELEPMIFWRTEERKNVVLLRLKEGNITDAINQIYKTIQNFDPQYHGEIKFLNQELQQQYSKEERTARFIEFVALWCILLALTGILGLMIFVSRDRTKEIGIRKVNGATISEILILLNKGFLIRVSIAFIIACPISYYSMNKWLQNFAYKTPLSWWVFALAGVITITIALLTVSWQSWRAATKNPVDALRYE